MQKKYAYLATVWMLSVGLVACGSSGSSSTTSSISSKAGLSLPTEISAVPTDQTVSSKSRKKSTVGLKSKLVAFRAATVSESDYSKAVTNTYVNEPTLEQFKIVEQVLSALGQTNYADATNIGAAPYKSMVSWQDEENGVATKTLEPWIVESDIIIEDGTEVTRARAWIESVEQGEQQIIKAEFKIYAAATQAADGSFSDYGVWTLNVKFGDQVTDFFAASASIGDDGTSVIKIHERFPEGPNFSSVVKAILNKSSASGFGKVSFPDWEALDFNSCASPENCFPDLVEAKYAYNSTHLAVQKAGESTPTFKDRGAITEMTHRYGIFDHDTGDNIFKTKNFGFPVFYTDSNGFRNYAFYGAWQGRHELWGGGESGVPAGTTVTRDDFGTNTETLSYTVSEPFVGTLVKRSTVAGELSDILNIPVETWINKNYNLRWNQTAGRWDSCVNPSWDPNTSMQTCQTEEDFTSTLPLLALSGEGDRKFVNINRWDNGNNQNLSYVYIPTNAAATTAGGSVAGFYLAQMNEQTGQMTMSSPATLYTPSDGDDMWVDIGGSIYIEYTGTGATDWLEKTVSSFDTRTWTPEFALGGNDYTLPEGQELYINSRGTNYIVKRMGSTTSVKLEIQTVATPLNFSSFLEANTVFKSQWNPDNDSTYTFDTNSTSSTFMKLVYATIGDNDRDGQGQPNTGVSVGAVTTQGQWGLVAYVGGTESATQFNWDYPREGENFGKITYLLDGDGAYVVLSDPIRLAPLTLSNNAGDPKTLSLQYDGWMGGLPDLYEELRKKGFVMDSTISDKIINIATGTVATDAEDSTKTYLIKPLEISQFLNPVSDPGGLDITIADAVDLSTVPNFVEHGMGTIPVVTTTKYSEGVLVE
ncbi:MAG: hypothetical protein GXO96_11420 [Nitrospirae bacterium]|nr:hypothetical protein [Candidatus Manganitrophaceae bacterium]